MKTFNVINLGCKVNKAESDFVESKLLEYGMRESEYNCDLVILNTCTVTAVAEKKTRKAVRRALNDNPSSKVIVTGCAAAQNQSLYEGISDRVKVVQKWDLSKYLSTLEPCSFAEKTQTNKQANNISDYCRANVKVQDGCINNCTYCIVCKVRGPEISVDPLQVLSRVKELAGSRIAEIMLSGINLGRYKYDDMDLGDLCAYLIEKEKRCRFRLSSIEPNNLTEKVIKVVASSNGSICRHFHLPLQSGCDNILQAMGRKYSASDYMEVVESIRRSMPLVSISTDVICGFPGESEQDFLDSLDFCERVGFSKMHVFPYSRREGTLAAEMTSQIDASEKNRRAKVMRQLALKLRQEDLAKRAGSVELAVVEDDEWCMTESYHRIRAPKESTPGTFIELKL